MYDSTLRARLAGMKVPTLILWGQSDGIVDVDYGLVYAQSIPESRFETISEAGHFPHLEQTAEVRRRIAHWARWQIDDESHLQFGL
jgi:pimeloyl-ACP methyl ester carboxylesterase